MLSISQSHDYTKSPSINTEVFHKLINNLISVQFYSQFYWTVFILVLRLFFISTVILFFRTSHFKPPHEKGDKVMHKQFLIIISLQTKLLKCIKESRCLSVRLSLCVAVCCLKHSSSMILMNLYTVAVYDLGKCMKEDYLGSNQSKWIN